MPRKPPPTLEEVQERLDDHVSFFDSNPVAWEALTGDERLDFLGVRPHLCQDCSGEGYSWLYMKGGRRIRPMRKLYCQLNCQYAKAERAKDAAKGGGLPRWRLRVEDRLRPWENGTFYGQTLRSIVGQFVEWSVHGRRRSPMARPPGQSPSEA